MPDVLQFYILSVPDFNILNLRKKSTFLTMLSSKRVSFWQNLTERERYINDV